MAAHWLRRRAGADDGAAYRDLEARGTR